MHDWQNYVSNLISLRERGKNIEKALKFNSLLQEQLSPTALLERYKLALEAKKLYSQALRTALLLSEKDFSSPIKFDLDSFAHTVESDLRRIEDVFKILRTKGKRWGFSEEMFEEEIKSPPMPSMPPQEYGTDVTAADDVDSFDFSDDILKAEIKHSLKALSNIVEYMERPTLLRIKKEIDKLVN